MTPSNRYRITAPAACRAGALAAACAAALSLAACSGGISTPSAAPSSPASSPAASPTTAPSSASATTPPASATTGTSGATSPGTGPGSSGTVSVGGSLGTFPIPPGATVVENVDNSDGQDAIELSGVQPSDLSSFYSTALPQAGYSISSNDVASSGVLTGAGIVFTGHGYKGNIGDADGIIGITLTPAS
jgi:hypothetical protein